jgi:hypothetical protein
MDGGFSRGGGGAGTASASRVVAVASRWRRGGVARGEDAMRREGRGGDGDARLRRRDAAGGLTEEKKRRSIAVGGCDGR